MLKKMFAEIGENSVIGAGSIMTKEVSQNVVAMGYSCKMTREINEHDMKYYNEDMEIDIE